MKRGILITAAVAIAGDVLRRVVKRRQAAPEVADVAGLAAREVVGTGDELLVVLHGPGAAPGQLERWLPTHQGPIVSFRGRHPYKDGYQWLTSRLQQTPPLAFMAEAEAVATQIGEGIGRTMARFGTTRCAVVGFSQGGHLAWILAARGLVNGAVIASGALPDTFTPPAPTRPIEITALGGTADKTVPWSLVDGTRARFSAAGFKVEAAAVPGGHSLQAIGPHLGGALNDVFARMSVDAS